MLFRCKHILSFTHCSHLEHTLLFTLVLSSQCTRAEITKSDHISHSRISEHAFTFTRIFVTACSLYYKYKEIMITFRKWIILLKIILLLKTWNARLRFHISLLIKCSNRMFRMLPYMNIHTLDMTIFFFQCFLYIAMENNQMKNESSHVNVSLVTTEEHVHIFLLALKHSANTYGD